MASLNILLKTIRQCQECAADLPEGPRPVVVAHAHSKILIVGQAPGIRVHQSGVPWDDPSGNRLREWMQVSADTFYDERQVAIVPMGFCYPGTGKNGDLPPRRECAELWHGQLLSRLEQVRLTLAIGQYAQRYLLKDKTEANLTKTVQAWQQYLPTCIPLPHPSPRNNRWLKQNPWFRTDVLPALQQLVANALK